VYDGVGKLIDVTAHGTSTNDDGFGDVTNGTSDQIYDRALLEKTGLTKVLSSHLALHHRDVDGSTSESENVLTSAYDEKGILRDTTNTYGDVVFCSRSGSRGS